MNRILSNVWNGYSKFFFNDRSYDKIKIFLNEISEINFLYILGMGFRFYVCTLKGSNFNYVVSKGLNDNQTFYYIVRKKMYS